MLLICQDLNSQLTASEQFIAENMAALDAIEQYMPPEQLDQTRKQLRDQLREQLIEQGIWQTPELPTDCYFYHCNHLGLPEALIDRNGQVIWGAEYDPWGNVQTEHNPQQINQAIRLPGQYQDSETDLYYNRHRYYDPALGRYINQDPIGLAGGVNNYKYPLNPSHGVDPLGLWEKLADNLQGQRGLVNAASMTLFELANNQR